MKTMKICAVVLVITMVCALAGTPAAADGKEAYLSQAPIVHVPPPNKAGDGKKGGPPRKVVKSSADLFSQSFTARKAAEAQERETALKKAARLGHDPGGDLLGGAKTAQPGT